MCCPICEPHCGRQVVDDEGKFLVDAGDPPSGSGGFRDLYADATIEADDPHEEPGAQLVGLTADLDICYERTTENMKLAAGDSFTFDSDAGALDIVGTPKLHVQLRERIGEALHRRTPTT